MPKRIRNSDPVNAVVLLDHQLMRFREELAHTIIAQLQEQFISTQEVKTSTKSLHIPQSVQWITPKTDENGEKIPNDWNLEKFVLVILPASFFDDLVEKSYSQYKSFDNLLPSLLGDSRIPTHLHIKVIFHDDVDKRSKALTEKQRVRNKDIEEWSTRCQVIHGVEIITDFKSHGDVATEVCRATKSILQLYSSRTEENFQAEANDIWIPRPGKPVAVTSSGGNIIGLQSLWQHYITQIAKVIGSEQAKVISSTPGFRSPSECFESFRSCSTEKECEELLSQRCIMRPSGNVKDLRTSKPKIGPETSRKFYRVMMSLNGNEKIKY